MTKPTGRQRFAPTARNPIEALLCYWYGLAGGAGAVLMELYRHPQGCRVGALLEALDSEATSNVPAVYVHYIRQALSEAIDHEAEVIVTIPGPIPQGPHSCTLTTVYKLAPAGRAEVQEYLEMAAEGLADVLADNNGAYVTTPDLRAVL